MKFNNEEEVYDLIDESKIGLGILSLKKESILFCGSMKDLIGKDFECSNIECINSYESNTFYIIDIDKSNINLFNTNIVDARDFMYNTVSLDLPENFNSKEDCIIFKLTH